MSFFHKKKASTKSHHAANAANVHMTEVSEVCNQASPCSLLFMLLVLPCVTAHVFVRPGGGCTGPERFQHRQDPGHSEQIHWRNGKKI